MNIKKNNINLLPPQALIKTGEVDYAEWNYKPILSYLQRKRFKLCLSLFEERKFNRVLEIGYGSGVFIPELNNYGNELYGIDIHNYNKEIEKLLMSYNTNAKLFQASATNIPFEDDYFDCIISISSIEFIDDIKAASLEIKRVLRKDGCFIVITPGHSWILDIGLKFLTGNSAKNDYKGRREKVIPMLYKYFDLVVEKIFPQTLGFIIPMYHALRLSPKK